MAGKYSRPMINEHPVGHPFQVFTNLYDVNDPTATTAWISLTSYVIDDIIKHDGKHYKCIVANSDASFERGKWQWLEGIPDETFYAILTGQTISDAESPFNTKVLVDARGLYPRGSGANGTLLRADGSPFDGGAVGSTDEDRFQAWQLGADQDDIGARDYWSILQQRGSAEAVSGNAIYGWVGTNINHQGSIQRMKAMNDGTNGTPRTGPETSPARFSAWWYVRKR